jgi:hypothetical protein
MLVEDNRSVLEFVDNQYHRLEGSARWEAIMRQRMRTAVRVNAAALFILGTVAFGQVTAPANTRAKLPFTISKETTAITGPLREDGTVDYVAALNEYDGKGVTPDNNGFVKCLEVLGTGDEVLARKRKTEFLNMCGAKETAAGQVVWESYLQYMKRTKGLNDADASKANDELSSAIRVPWRAEEHPDLAAYLKSQEKLLAVAAQAGARPKWWLPTVTSDGKSMFTLLLPSLRPFSDMANTLSARAVWRASTGDVEGFLADISTVQQLSRHVGNGAMLIERLVAVAMDRAASNAVATVAASGKLTEAQCKLAMSAMEGAGMMSPMTEALDIGERWNQLDGVQWIALGQTYRIASVLSADSDYAKIFVAFGELDRDRVDWDVAFKKVNGLIDGQLKAMHARNIADLKGGMAAWEKDLDDIKNRAKAETKSVHMQPEETRVAYSQRVANLIVGVFMPTSGKAEEQYRRGVLQAAMARVVLAAASVKAKTGQWPLNLDALVPGELQELPRDPYSEGGAKPLRYLLKPTGPWVYSVGDNGRDDGAMREGTEKDDWGAGAS